MDLFEGGDEGAVVVITVCVGEGLPGAKFFEQVVYAGDGDVGVGGLDAFAVSIEPLAQVVNYSPLKDIAVFIRMRYKSVAQFHKL